ncbi:UNVERIFIED_CONTAM: Transcription factor [Sesamum angustifolium]|uniref:Transcription factor n=1 Tax=Sesamum angustifolium TaxID=2727405 RepID=A0AAW2QD52_9LAMI
MNSGLPEMLHCLNTNSASTTDMTVLQRQRSRLKWQHEHLIQHQPLAYFNENDASGASLLPLDSDQGLGEMLPPEAMKPDPGAENGWIDDFGRVLNYGNGSEFEMCYPLPRTVSCRPNVAAAMAAEVASKGKEAALSSDAGRESSKKRKADKNQNLKVGAEDKSEEKKMKGCVEEESKITEQNSNSKSTTTTGSTATNKKNCKGPSTNNSKENSKASDVPKPDYIHVRARRGQATDSHSLAERFLSMKLAAINPRLDFDIDNYLAKEIFPACTSNLPTIGASAEMQIQHVTWVDELQNLYSMEYQQERSTSFISQPFAGFPATGHVKLEM